MNQVRSYTSRLLSKTLKFSSRNQKLHKFRTPIKNDSFHESIGLMLTIGQFFAQVPIVGVLEKNYRKARFEMCNFRTIYACFFMSVGFLEGCLSFKRTQSLNYSIGSMQSLLFICVCLSSTTLLFSLARKWNSFIRFWQEHETDFLQSPYIINGMRLKAKINLVSITFLTLSLMEHVLFIVAAVDYDYKQFTICQIKDVEFLKFFFLKERPHVFLVIPFHYTYVLPSLWLSLTMAFCWNYVDLMIMVVSIGISTRFEQINSRLKSSIKTFQNVNDSFWRDIRKSYVHAVDIVQMADDKISSLVLLSCASNLYYICLQLFNSFTEIPFFLSFLYFWYSLIFLIGRALFMLSFAASIHDASRKSISMLHEIPSKLWTNETQRFLDMVTAECHALSGMKFFYLTKNMILAMAGTVVTYELVLLDEVEQEAERKSICNITNFNFSSYIN